MTASELHYKAPATEEIPTIGCGNGINDGITLNGITIVPKDTEITWSCDDMCSRTEAMLRNIHSADILGVRWGPQVGSEFLEWLTTYAHP